MAISHTGTLVLDSVVQTERVKSTRTAVLPCHLLLFRSVRPQRPLLDDFHGGNLFLWSWLIAGGRGGDRGCYLLQRWWNCFPRFHSDFHCLRGPVFDDLDRALVAGISCRLPLVEHSNTWHSEYVDPLIQLRLTTSSVVLPFNLFISSCNSEFIVTSEQDPLLSGTNPAFVFGSFGRNSGFFGRRMYTLGPPC